MPFGWATAVADLDSDAKLDFAIADRTSYGANGYNYRLQLTLSRAESQVFQFHSADSALKVSVVDLDNDADLDIVLTHAISGEIAGVWLNNGSGDFHEGQVEDFQQAGVQLKGSVTIGTANNAPALAGTTFDRKPVMRAAKVVPDNSSTGGGPAVNASSYSRAGPEYYCVIPRSPPQTFPS